MTNTMVAVIKTLMKSVTHFKPESHYAAVLNISMYMYASLILYAVSVFRLLFNELLSTLPWQRRL